MLWNERVTRLVFFDRYKFVAWLLCLAFESLPFKVTLCPNGSRPGGSGFHTFSNKLRN